jgi:hypothetical protein
MMRRRGLLTVSVTRSDNYGKYWIRGNGISNCARIYAVVGEDPDGTRREIHVAFDDWPPNHGQLEILMEREVPREDVKKPTAEAPPTGLWDPQHP